MLVSSFCCKLSIFLCSLFIFVLFSIPFFFLLFFFFFSFLFILSFFSSFFPYFLSFLPFLAIVWRLFFVFCVSLLHPTITCSFLHTSPCWCMLHPLRFTLLLLVASFMFHPTITRCIPHISPCYYLLSHTSLVVTCSFALSLVATYSFFCDSPYYYLLLLSCSTLQLLILSFAFHLATYLQPRSCFTLLLPAPSFTLHPSITYSFFCVLPHNYLFSPLCFTLLVTYSFAFHHVVSVMDANAMMFNYLNVHPWLT